MANLEQICGGCEFFRRKPTGKSTIVNITGLSSGFFEPKPRMGDCVAPYKTLLGEERKPRINRWAEVNFNSVVYSNDECVAKDNEQKLLFKPKQ